VDLEDESDRNYKKAANPFLEAKVSYNIATFYVLYNEHSE
jgi:hypothetical protein